MTMKRFDFQRECVAQTTGLVLNVGAKEDPGRLMEHFGRRVVNCDISVTREYDDSVRAGRQVFDCTDVWPWETDSAQMVVFGDILEHLEPARMAAALAEAARVAHQLCVTVPVDDRPKDSRDPWHITVVTEEMLRGALMSSGWDVKTWREVDYNFVPQGFFVLAERREV